ncbi:transcription intermediary factor 1-alpha isoform X3 [Syngnathoides biaculeatus]|uniref:transcription intermediary factor 1-alpha isoform X3 n=1 Tax=Syngnathoides biaculeatus TaxID=300417 RepID=UPI002ADE3088|nr:transcription intermediary factor 1-alpha isoform X3 [Syngnathoides biaculeatus]
MDSSGKSVGNDDIVIIVENEAESLPLGEPRPKPPGAFGLMDTCPICKLSFHNREPKLLPCLHSFCKRCLPAPFRGVEPRRDHSLHTLGQVDSNKQLGTIRCPVCRQECWEMDLLDNFFVKDSAEVPSSTMEKNNQVCMSCDDNTEATGYCLECMEFLCVTCIEAHQRVKFTRDHTIRQKKEMSPGSMKKDTLTQSSFYFFNDKPFTRAEAVAVSTQKPVFCDIHKQEPLKLFCETCDRLTCRDCQLLKHKDHNYQFLEDAYKNHRQYLESMTQQLQEKRKAIEDVSTCIRNGLQQVEENRKSVTNEIKKAICNLIMEINRKGKVLANQLESLTKDHELGLKKQQEEVNLLRRQLDHVISFTKWATASHSGTALLYCKRLILFQIHYLMGARCSASIIPQSSVRFQCRSGFWASNVDLGSLVVERSSVQALIPNQQPGPRGEAQTGAMSLSAQQRQSTLAQLQMQVDKISQQPHRQAASNHWSWYQNARLPGPPGPHGPPPPTRPIQGGSSPSQGLSGLTQMGRRYGNAPGNIRSPNSSILQNSGFPPSQQGTFRYPHPMSAGGATHVQPTQRNLSELSYLKRTEAGGGPVPPVNITLTRPNFGLSQSSTAADKPVQAKQNSPVVKSSSSERNGGPASWKANTETSSAPSAKRRRRSSPGPIIVIKDEPEDEDEVRFSSLPDSSTGACPTLQLKIGPPFSTHQSDSGQAREPRPQPGAPAESEKSAPAEDDPNEDWCAVCQNGGELLCCDKCPKVFHLSCHIPVLSESPSGAWFCSFCRDLVSPEMQYECDNKNTHDHERLPPVDQRSCERLLLLLFCNDFSTHFHHASESKRYKELIARPMDLSLVKRKLEWKASDGERYRTPEEFVADVRLIFMNCAKYKVNKEVISAGLYLEDYFEEQLRLVYPNKIFPGGREEGMIPPLEDEIDDEEEEQQQEQEQEQQVPTQESPTHTGGDKTLSPAENAIPPVEENAPPAEEAAEENLKTKEQATDMSKMGTDVKDGSEDGGEPLTQNKVKQEDEAAPPEEVKTSEAVDEAAFPKEGNTPLPPEQTSEVTESQESTQENVPDGEKEEQAAAEME